MTTARRLLAPIVLAATLLLPHSVSAIDFMFRATVDGETFEGKPLAWTDYEMHLLGRDGRLHHFNPREAKNAKKTSPTFVSYSVPEMRRTLEREFGNAFDVTATKHYLVVHPRGGSNQWPQRFEELYRSFMAYFRVRGFHLEEPEFPLVAVVYPNQDDFKKSVSNSGGNASSGTLGLYYPNSNRVELFDLKPGTFNSDWFDTAHTIIHEATHQTAYNVGIHNRFADQPVWLAEGLATMFEARGVRDSQSFHSFNDRINHARLADFRAGLKQRQPGTLLSLVASDKLFETDVTAAYANAWALTLYLCETRPRELAEYFQMTAARPDFSAYFATQRVADFKECFGSDLKKLEANFLAWTAQIK